VSSVRLYPPALPIAHVDGHAFQSEPNARKRPRDQGEMRMRPRFRSVPELLTATWMYKTQEEFDAFDAFYEDALLSGSLEFDVPVHDRGTPTGRRWYTAQVVGDYRCDFDLPRIYRVTATLRLIEDLGTVRIPPGIQATIGINFGLTARTQAPTVAATIGLNFIMTAQAPVPAPGALISLDFAMAWVVPSGDPLLSQDRETDAGEARETDAGDDRQTD
jgi:hypothetical protein